MTMTNGSGVEVDIYAGLCAQIGNLATAVQSLQANQARQDIADSATRYIKPPAAFGTLNGSGDGYFDLGGPNAGYMWTVRRITVVDAASLTANMGGGTAIAGIYAGNIAGAQQVATENLEWIIGGLPNVANFSADQLVLQYGEHLYVQIANATADENVKVSIAYQLYRPAQFRGVEGV
jgi:hypothetical protein